MSAFRRAKLSSILLRTLVASFALAGLAFGAENPLGEIMTNSDGAITNSPVDGVRPVSYTHLTLPTIYSV